MFDPESEQKEQHQPGDNGRAELRVVSDRVSESYCTVLRNARIKRELSLADVSRALKIPQNLLDALEHQEYEKLPADAYAVGYIRSYAGFLGLNPEGLVKDFRQDKAFKEQSERQRLLEEQQLLEEKRQQEPPTFEKRLSDWSDNAREFIYRNVVWFGVAVALMLGVLLWLVFENTRTKVHEDQVINTIEAVTVENADGSISVTNIMDHPQSTPLIAQEAAVSGLMDIKLLFSGVTWVTIRDANGELVHQSRTQLGDEVELRGGSPLFLRLSKASVASLFVNGEAMDFSAQVSPDDQLHDFQIVRP